MFSANSSQVSTAANYIEDVFSTWLYTGTGASQTIPNNIALSTNGGMVWMKSRSAATNHAIYDTARGATFDIASNTTAAQTTQATGLTAFGTTGFTIGSLAKINTSAATYTSWTFREQPKFFDIVTYTGTGSARTIAHNLGSVPGCIIVRGTSAGTAGFNWRVYHRSLTSAAFTLSLNSADAQSSRPSIWNSTAPTSTVFSVGTDGSVNGSGDTYVAYLFAHDAGGFGNAGTDNVISCGSFTSTGSALSVSLGYEPQWLLFKPSSGAGDWNLVDNMRGFQVDRSGATVGLQPNLSAAEAALGLVGPTSTGFTFDNGGSGVTYIYIAIRRGPMKTPTLGTSVFSPVYATFNGTTVTNTNFVTDLAITKIPTTSVGNNFVLDRLRGSNNSASQNTMSTNATSAESESSGRVAFTGTVTIQNGFLQQTPSASVIVYAFGRAPGFFDEVCYTGTGANRTVSHNLGVVPELIITKKRSAPENWFVYNQTIGNTKFLQLQASDNAQTNATYWNNTSPTSSVFSLGTGSTNDSSATYVAYLFATVAGVSKVGSYTGTAALQTINCGFTAGARFVLIKRTDSTGDWYVWDSARGIVAGNDPYLLLNSTAPGVTNTDWVDTAASGFELSNAAGNLVNVVGGAYIFLAIA